MFTVFGNTSLGFVLVSVECREEQEMHWHTVFSSTGATSTKKKNAVGGVVYSGALPMQT